MYTYDFNELLAHINERYRVYNKTDKAQPTGIRYFKSMEPYISLISLADETQTPPKYLAYLSKN